MQNNKQENIMGIIANNMRTKRIMGKFYKKYWKEL